MKVMKSVLYFFIIKGTKAKHLKMLIKKAVWNTDCEISQNV